MDVFSKLDRRIKITIVASTLFLLSLSLSVLMFGGDMQMEAQLIEHAREAARTDMLYSHPEYTPQVSEPDQDVVID